MAISNKSHARKTDKETQSPVLKIFKEIMRRENNDPEKTNLLKEMQEDRKKKKHHSTSKSKSDNKIRDSNSSDRQRKNTRVPFKTNVEQMNVDQLQGREEQSVPFHSEKKDSWWFWGDDQPKAEEDTCSCVSCALKRICSSENMCIGGYFILFVLSVMLALFLVFKNIPNLSNVDPTEKASVILDSERLKRKIEMLKDGRHQKYSDGDAKLKGVDERKVWDGSGSNNFDGLSGLSDFGSSNLRELNSLEDSNELPSDLSSIMINDNLIDDGTNENLRNFYKKLIQTDERIRNLKKGLTNYNTNTEFNFKLSDRAKRSLVARRPMKKSAAKIKKDTIGNNGDKEEDDVTSKFHILYPPLHLLNLYTPVTQKTPDISGRFKRYDNYTKNPMGLVIERKKLILRYKPDVAGKRIVAKCSHVPKESKSHENQLKHPFYKNTQRLDELLDQFVDKNAPQDPNNQFQTNDLFQRSKSLCKHPKIIKDSNLGYDNTNSQQLLQDLTTDKNNGDKEHTTDMDYLNKKDPDSDEEATDSYKVMMSISTLINSDGKTVTVPKHKDPRLRKLMQFDEKDDESQSYADLNEVLDDNTGTNDDNDKESDRIKRMGETYPNSNQLPNNPNNHNPQGVLNPNWKGPMPLYPDELNSMIKQAALNFNKIQVKLDKDGLPETIEGAKELSDMEYVEDYLSSKNDRLVKMAQAYSDYGVLEGKKETIGRATTQIHNALEKRAKLETSKRSFFNGGLLGKWKKKNPIREITQEFSKPDTEEGIRFEMRPTSVSREDNPKDMFEIIRKHVKVVHNNGEDKEKIHSPYSTSDIDSFSPMKFHVNDEIQKFITSTTSAEKKYNTYTFPKGKRSLQSIDLVDDFESKNNDGEDGEFDDADQEKYAANLEIEKNNDSLILIKKDRNQSESFTNSAIQNSGNRFIKKIDAKKSSIVDTKDITASVKNNSEVKENDSRMVFSDFFSLLAKCFSALDGVDVHANKHESNHSSTKTDINKKISTKKNKSSELIYPIYDSDMIDNIGHRSRVLMSFEEKPNATIDQNIKMTHLMSDGKKKTDVYSIKTDKNTEVPVNFTTTSLKGHTKTKTKINAITNNVEKKGDKKNKTIVKRNAEDSNLIFWNDIYDEEYGVQLDPLENTFRDKDSIMTYNNLMRNSKLWLQTKIKRFKDNMRRSTQKATNKNSKKRPSRSLDPLGTAMHEKGFNVKHNNKVFKRDSSYNLDDDDLDAAKGTNFAELTDNMKKVCQKAARAVQKTRNKEVREDTKDETAASSLMQQLVHLMTDLVDYQVEQKTCVKLPPDLSSFLVWLTSPNQESDPFKVPHHVHDAVDILSYSGDDDGYYIPGLPETIMPSSSEKEENHPESRSECLGTLQAVQELMHEFDAMSEGDKSKMTGIREYLQSQMEYLNQQLYTEENYIPRKMYSSMRYKRLANKNRRHKKRRRHRRAKRKLHRFIKNFSKKHTRSTASYYETMQETECQSERKTIVRNSNDKPKRNLKDVYFKAVLDAKKATIKTIQRKDDKKSKDE